MRLNELMIFFFKQKTAYEMRISDWSSDVCSSDLSTIKRSSSTSFALRSTSDAKRIASRGWPIALASCCQAASDDTAMLSHSPSRHGYALCGAMRLEERRGGNACVSTCSSRCYTSLIKK